jgi:amidase
MDVRDRSATELCGLLARRELRSRELLEALADRLAERNPELRAVVATNLEAARARADAADRALARGERRGPLHGLPLTVKDTFETVDLPTTSGSPTLAAHMAARNADAVERLLDAGAIVFGKSNTPLFAGDCQAYNEVHGTTGNPWDLARTPGGSSGGSAAALAAGLTPLELGSDIGGSIRNPAHFCGVYGHKPTFGIVPMRGHIPGPPGLLVTADLAVCGPLARTAADLALALGVLAGPSPVAAKGWRLELPPPRRERLREVRAALWLEAGPIPLAREVGALLQGAADALGRAGVRIDDRARPDVDPDDAYRLYARMVWGEMAPGVPPAELASLDERLGALRPSDRSPDAERTRGVSGRHRDWLADTEAREQMRARWAAFFERFDLLLCPIMPTAAFPHDHSPIDARTIDVDGRRYSYWDQIFWAGLVTIAYLPATVAPVGRTRAGLPVGLQIVAPHLEDHTSIRFAELMADVTGGFEPPPRYREPVVR